MKRRITLLLMALMVVTTALPQTTTRSKGESKFPGSTSRRGANWEKFTINDKTYEYFKGSKEVDELTTEKLLGFHWKGSKYTDVIGEELYLCNMETGEYLQIGDIWGENGMTSHVGIPYLIVPGTSTRRSGWGGPLSDMVSDTYWLQPQGVRQERVIGRSGQPGAGAEEGHFEYNKYLYLRTQMEYQGDPTGTGPHAGGFLFKFKEYNVGNQTCYVIYTHRQTKDQGGKAAEYGNRDSYLMLTSVGASSTADYNNVRFEKFAGQMYGPTTVTITDKTDIVANSMEAAQGNNDHKYGTYENAAGGTLFTTNATSGKAGVTVATDAAILRAGWYNGDNYKHVMRFAPLDANEYTITISAPSGYVITGYAITGAIANQDINPVYVTPEGGSRTEVGAGGNRKNFTVSNLSVHSTTLKIQAKNGSGGLNFPNFTVTIVREGETYDVVNTGNNAYLNNPLGDEKAYFNNGVSYVSLTDGLATVSGEKKNLWKIVTRKERDRYRIVASDAKPVDVSSRIFNPTFNTSYIYNIAYENCNDTDGDGHWIANNTNLHPDYGWTWYNRDASTHPTTPHVHPWPTTPNVETKETALGFAKGKEFHKVGTGRFWRFSERNAANNGYIGGHDNDMQEMNITTGIDANYCGSIYEGSANLQQTITGLRAGNYIVYVRGFFAPHDMEKYVKSGESYTFDGEVRASGYATTFNDGSHGTDTWYQEAVVSVDGTTGEPTWRRSHDSYLFAWTNPDWKSEEDPGTPEEVRRMLPSVYEGATPVSNIGTLSKNSVLTGADYPYSPMNGKSNEEKNLIKDEHVFGFYNGGFFGFDKGVWTGDFIVPRTVSGAARFFSAIDVDDHPEAQNYRIGLPVYVGDDGTLTIGVDHTEMTDAISYTQVIKEKNEAGEWVEKERNNYTMPPSGRDEWVCFDEFELLYLGKDEGDLFVIDELNAQGNVGGYKYICGNTGEEMTSTDVYAPFYDFYSAEDIGGESDYVKRQNNTKALDLFDADFDIAAPTDETKVVKNVLIRRSLTKNGWNSIVLPVPLTRAQVEEGFGEGTKVSKLKGVQGRILVYEAVTGDLEAGQPYIIYPTEDPLIPAGGKFEREPFTIKVSTTLAGVAGLYFKSSQYERNYEIDHTLAGPLYFIPDVEIYLKQVFPVTDPTKSGTEQWTPSKTWSKDGVRVRGESGRSFTLKEKAYYENPGIVKKNSYYFNKGQIRYADSDFSTTKGLMSVVQLTYMDGETEVLYDKPFFDDVEYYVDNSETTGIDETFSLPDDPLNLDIYDLMGRKVTNPRPGSIYIMNGKKLLFK